MDNNVNAGERAALALNREKGRDLYESLHNDDGTTQSGLAPIRVSHYDPRRSQVEYDGPRELGWGPSFETDASLLFPGLVVEET